MKNGDDATQQGVEGSTLYASLHPSSEDGLMEVRYPSLTLACEDAAKLSWRALCNGRGMVDAKTRAVFRAAEKAYRDSESTGTIHDYIASAIERRVKRGGYLHLHVDGLTYGVRTVHA